MAEQLNNIVRFRGDRLFNGAVSIGWFGTDNTKSQVASQAFVFHGPKYHGVQQEDVGTLHGHRLQDTASFTRAIVQRCYGVEDQPFTLAIAGYGTGKSHLGLTLANLLSSPGDQTAKNILAAIEAADADISEDIRLILRESSKPCLAIALNGMQSFDFAAEFTKQIVRILKRDGHDSKPLDDLRPRFGQAASLVRMSNDVVVNELLAASDAVSVDLLISDLEQQDERAYAKVHDFFAARGMPIRALTGESVRDVIDITVREYCGTGKPYRSLLVLFDEFGKYTEFATIRSQIAGSGVLQDLFEGIQANASNACFVGFIQFELNAYIQRIAPEYKNEILRYITRYQSANKLYLSINLETLIASLLEKRQAPLLNQWFESSQAKQESVATMSNLARWFPQSKNYRLWGDADQFHNVVSNGCWPLSPYSTWLLFYLASAGKHLQERSALALLSDVFQRFNQKEIIGIGEWTISPADLWSEMLQQELISSEEIGQQGSIAHAYASVTAKHGARFPKELIMVLRAVVMASKLGLQVANKSEAITALGMLAGVSQNIAENSIRLLQEEYNVLEWDESFKAFDILGDAVPRTQFLAFVRQRVASSYDESGKAQLFASKASEWCDLLGDLECDFAELNKITTREWRYQAATSNLNYLAQQIKIASDQWATSIEVDDPRGTIIYVYIDQSRDPDAIIPDARKLLKTAAREVGPPALPVLLILLHDKVGALGQALSEYAVLDDISDTDKARFGNLIGAHKEKLSKAIREQIDAMIKERRYVTGLKEDLATQRLSQVGAEIFSRIYKNPIPFPFDGFSTARGNAADTCHELTRELLSSKLDYDGVISKPIKAKNRAITVLKENWGIFNKNGSISRRPILPVIRTLTEKWDDTLTNEQRISLAEAIRQICRPPYGANIASAGLFLGVFLAPRAEKLVVVRDGEQIAIAQWLQDGIFRGKFINLSMLHGMDLMQIGEASSEWETLLDEWEQCADHLSRFSSLQRSFELKKRLPVPPLMVYREERLREQAMTSMEALKQMEKDQDDAFSKLENGMSRRDVALLAWGAGEVKKLSDKMLEEKSLWAESQVSELYPYLERTRLAVIHFFPEWISQQAPRSEAPSDVGDFKHKMLRLVGANLKKLELESEFEKLEAHTLQVIKNAESIAEARQIIRDIQSWLTSHADATRIGRVSEIRALKQVGTDYSRKIQTIAKRIQLPEIGQVRTDLSDFLHNLKNSENEIVHRASAIWDTNIQTEIDIEKVLDEVESLFSAFENLPSDQEDFQLMRKALRQYKKCFNQLSDDNLTWPNLDKLADKIKKENQTFFENDEEIPWDPDETIDAFIDEISKQREEKSLAWINTIENEAEDIASMPAAEANRLLARVNSHPSLLTPTHKNQVKIISQKITARLEELTLEWLVEKFIELPSSSKKEFLRMAQQLIA
jgi:hypothetical protein